MKAFRNIRKVEMVDIPALKEMILRLAFVDVKELKMENASLLENHEKLGVIKRKQEEERLRLEKEKKDRREKGIVLRVTSLAFRIAFIPASSVVSSFRSSHQFNGMDSLFITNALFFFSSPLNVSSPIFSVFSDFKSSHHLIPELSLSNTVFSQFTKQPSPILTS